MKLAALAMVLFVLPQDEKITLKFAPKQGDKVTRTAKSELKMVTEFEVRGMVQEIEFEHRTTEKLVTEYAAVAEGKVERKVYDFKESYEEKKAPPNPEQWDRTDKPVHGRKISVSVKDGKTVHEGAEGLPEKELKKIPLEERAARIFPKHPVAVGDSWEVKDEDVREFLESDAEIKSAKLKLKLSAIKEIEKRRCAVLTAALEMEGRGPQEVGLTVKLEGELVVWIERGYVLDFKGKGKVTMKGTNDQFAMSGEGTLSMEQSSKVE